jgi:hypothetical protein
VKTVRKRRKQGRAPSRRDLAIVRRIATVVTVAMTVISIAGYVVLSLLANNAPPELGSDFASGSEFYNTTAWAQVIQPATESQADTITLTADLSTFGDTAMFFVSVCGPSPTTKAAS